MTEEHRDFFEIKFGDVWHIIIGSPIDENFGYRFVATDMYNNCSWFLQ